MAWQSYSSSTTNPDSAGYNSCSKRSLCLEIPTAEDTEEVGALFSAIVLESMLSRSQETSEQAQQQGTTIFLDGDLGAGKTAFARGFLRAATGDDTLRVTSPTYLLVNVYPILSGATEIHHMDLYRLSGKAEDLLPLNLPQVFQNCISLIEWPERLGSVPIPDERLEINIRISVDDTSGDKEEAHDSGEDNKARIMTILPHGAVWQERMLSLKEGGYLDDLLKHV